LLSLALLTAVSVKAQPIIVTDFLTGNRLGINTNVRKKNGRILSAAGSSPAQKSGIQTFESTPLVDVKRNLRIGIDRGAFKVN
jgi:hypothetical protein